MSLDVYLKLENAAVNGGSGIFVRQNGQTVEISRAEWDEKFPDREPIVASPDDDNDYVFEANITHNLNTMAAAAGIYEVLWRPEEFLAPDIAERLHVAEKEKGYHHEETNAIRTSLPQVHALNLIEPLRWGLAELKARPERFKQHNPANGWGSYDVFVPWVEKYLNACEKYPNALVSVSR